MELVIYPANILRRRAALVPDPRSAALACREMLELMRTRDGIGLAAPQVGISGRFFVLGLPRDRDRVFINPEIIAAARRQSRSEESCLSLPGVTVEVPRYPWVDVRAWDETGEPFEIRARGLLARAIQHELDHLNGVLCIDRIDQKRRGRIERGIAARPEARDYGTTAGHSSR